MLNNIPIFKLIQEKGERSERSDKTTFIKLKVNVKKIFQNINKI